MNPKRVSRWTIAALCSAIVLLGLTVASATPVGMRRKHAARLRLSWTARPERIEVCRTLTPAELAKLEEHMRQRVQCDGRFATYALRVESDGVVAHESVVQGAGLRHDRPLYLLREIDIAPGTHRVRVTFTRREKMDAGTGASAHITAAEVDTGLFAGRAQREASERARRVAAAIPRRLELDTTLVFVANRVVVVSLDGERRTLRLMGK
jgi:hypothetical protein